MDKADIISNLKANSYSFEDKGEQVIVKLAPRYFLKLYIENDTIVKDEDMLKQLGLLTYGKSLKIVFKISMIGYLIYFLFFSILCILDPHFFNNGGKYFFITVAPVVIYQLLEFWFYNKRLLKIKKLLNLND